MPAPEILPCPLCNRPVVILPSAGGRGSGNLTSYLVMCPCGLNEEDFGMDGTKRTALREWNKWVKAHSKNKNTDGNT